MVCLHICTKVSGILFPLVKLVSVIYTQQLGYLFKILYYANYAKYDQYGVERGYTEMQCLKKELALPVCKWVKSALVRDTQQLVYVFKLFSKNRPLADSFIESRCTSVTLGLCLSVTFPCNFF